MSALLLILVLAPAAPARAWLWTPTLVDGSGNMGQYCSLAIDRTGRLHAAYFEYDALDPGSQNLRYAVNPSPRGAGAWSRITVDGSAYTGAYASIALTWNDIPHIAYYEAYYQDLRHAWYDSTLGGWRHETVDQSGIVGQFSSIAVSGSTVYIAYFDASRPGLKVATKEPGNPWTFEYADTDGAVGLYASLNVDLGLQVAYYDLNNRDLKVAVKENGGWTVTRVDSLGDVGRSASITVNAFTTFVAYYDLTHGALKVATRPEPGDPWSTVTVDDDGNAGEGASVFSDRRGRPHVAYYERSQGDFRYAGRYQGTWITNTVASAGDVGRFCSARIDADDLPNLLYYSFTDQDLHYAYGVGDPTGVEDSLPPPGPRVTLQARPNPTRGASTLWLETGGAGPAEVVLFDLQGRALRTLYRGRLEAGPHSLAWDGRDDSGRTLPAGIYYVSARTASGRASARIVLLH